MFPTIHREGSFRFFLYSHEPREPPHVHVERDDAVAKFWLHDAALVDSGGFPPRDLQRVAAIVVNHWDDFLEAWNEHFGEP